MKLRLSFPHNVCRLGAESCFMSQLNPNPFSGDASIGILWISWPDLTILDCIEHRADGKAATGEQ
jgi:hypothetical protein